MRIHQRFFVDTDIRNHGVRKIHQVNDDKVFYLRLIPDQNVQKRNDEKPSRKHQGSYHDIELSVQLHQ